VTLGKMLEAACVCARCLCMSPPLHRSSAWSRTRAWEVARTVVAAPSSVVKCLWEVFVWGVVLVVCVRVCVVVGGVVLCRCVRVCVTC